MLNEHVIAYWQWLIDETHEHMGSVTRNQIVSIFSKLWARECYEQQPGTYYAPTRYFR